MTRLLIVLDDERCWLWDARNSSNTSGLIWVHYTVWMTLNHRENQVLEGASRALASFIDSAKAAAVSALWNYFVSELRQSASQNLSKKDGAVKTATFFSERFCEAD